VSNYRRHKSPVKTPAFLTRNDIGREFSIETLLEDPSGNLTHRDDPSTLGEFGTTHPKKQWSHRNFFDYDGDGTLKQGY
jgi:hypothetical protein